jgi:hypothetical protein
MMIELAISHRIHSKRMKRMAFCQPRIVDRIAVNLAEEAVNLGNPSTGESGENRRKRPKRGPVLGFLRRARSTAEKAEPAGKALFAVISGNDAVNLNLASTYHLYIFILAVAVGIPIARHPPHKTVRALLRIRLPPWMCGVKTCHRIGM